MIITLGGGSSMDLGKAIALAVTVELSEYTAGLKVQELESCS